MTAISKSKCGKCGNAFNDDELYFQKHSGTKFCKECFIKDTKRKVRKNLGKNILKNHITIGVGISGGKDSLVMAHILNEFFNQIPNSKIVGIMVNEGIEGFRNDGIEKGIKFCEEYGIEYHIVTFSEYIDSDLDSIVAIAKEKNMTMNPCSFCGVIRRKILNRVAIEKGCDYLAIGHNLDDISQAVMMNYIEGDIKKLAILGKSSQSDKFVKRIKPLSKIPEEEVKLFADILEMDYHKEPCPYSCLSYRSEVSDIIDTLEEKHAGAMYSIVAGYERLLEYLEVPESVSICEKCGEPSALKICKVCSFLKDLGLEENSKF
ncbi:uncharacterized protein (TIGR00269 family) [Methanococcus voltae PS]|uniref:Uncharacterized protein (TIGR00269 family) n=2 Tax=Methanococcus voltae TaxID=2188 RepID=A0ABT2EUN3_METVO|nr:TIGR00269 family protein [Methanococcus voltae]ABD17746.1 putative GMP synthase [Methanococcus voltae PS]MCS3921664.1 uncharacterized protein (TIGR00269 family) [Methanococcus voltae PS]